MSLMADICAQTEIKLTNTPVVERVVLIYRV